MDTIFGKRLKELREERGVSQPALAKELGVSRAIVSFWENGLREPTLSNLVALADYFDESIDYLAGREK